jgi:hypothetical protein
MPLCDLPPPHGDQLTDVGAEGDGRSLDGLVGVAGLDPATATSAGRGARFGSVALMLELEGPPDHLPRRRAG